MRGTAAPLQRGPFSLTIPDTVGYLEIPNSPTGSSLEEDFLPWLAPVDIFMTPSITSASFSGQDQNTLPYGAYLSFNLLNAYIGWDIVLAAGTWTFELIYSTLSNGGIMAVQVDGNTVGSFDMYAAVAALTRGSITSISVPESKQLRVRFDITGKNASSGGYQCRIVHFQLRRTA